MFGDIEEEIFSIVGVNINYLFLCLVMCVRTKVDTENPLVSFLLQFCECSKLRCLIYN